MQNEKELVDVCIEYGAFKASMVSIDKNSRAYCEANQYGYFGKNYACHPTVRACTSG